MSSKKSCEIFISGLTDLIEPHTILTYFEQFGEINHYNFLSPNTGGIVFLSYENIDMVNFCMKNRPHRLDGRIIYVKRAVPNDNEYLREHIDTSRDLMIVVDSFVPTDEYLNELREYFSSYGALYACKYCHENSFDYILIEFADYDQVDRIILDKPHYFHDKQLNIAKCTIWNKNYLNKKYTFEDNSDEKSFENEKSLIDENEIIRLQNKLKNLTEDFVIQRKQLEDDCCEQLRQLNENADQTYRLQQDLEKEYSKLLEEYETLKKENNHLSEQYLMAELEKFEITCHYEQILAEEKAKTARYESIYQDISNTNSPFLPAIPDDD